MSRSAQPFKFYKNINKIHKNQSIAKIPPEYGSFMIREKKYFFKILMVLEDWKVQLRLNYIQLIGKYMRDNFSYIFAQRWNCRMRNKHICNAFNVLIYTFYSIKSVFINAYIKCLLKKVTQKWQTNHLRLFKNVLLSFDSYLSFM